NGFVHRDVILRSLAGGAPTLAEIERPPKRAASFPKSPGGEYGLAVTSCPGFIDITSDWAESRADARMMRTHIDAPLKELIGTSNRPWHRTCGTTERKMIAW